MATSASATSRVDVSGLYKNTVAGAEGSQKLNPAYSRRWTNGTGNYQFNRWYEEVIALAAAPVNRDLFGTITDIFGNTLSLATVKILHIHHQGIVAGEPLIVSGNFITSSVLAGTTPTKTTGAAGVWHEENPIDGFTVTATSADIITLDPGAKTFNVLLFIGGTE